MSRYANRWGLTVQEYRVLQMLSTTARGVSKNVMRSMNLTQKTLDGYILEACRKMGAANRVEAALMFDREHGPRAEPPAPGNVTSCGACRGLGFTARDSHAGP